MPPVATAVADDCVVGIHVVVSVWRADIAPLRVVEVSLPGVGHVLVDEFPARIEVERRVRRCQWGVGGCSRHERQHSSKSN